MNKPRISSTSREVRVHWEDLSRAIELHLEKNYTVSWHRDRFGGRFYLSFENDRAVTIAFEATRPRSRG